ncbi:MAG: hypothetical protein KC506_03890 [Nanoarchaeota archaeon]|nr:hypothetical protein [Nanoarchaeota archaeon]
MSKITASLMIEIMGKPAEHVKEALQTLVTRIGSEKGVKVTNKIYHEPKKVEGSQTLYTAFSEIEAEFDELANYFMVIFSYMPSHVEIITPEKIEITNGDLNELSNALTQRLHNYDAVTKNAVMEKDLLTRKLKEVAPELFKDYDPKKPLPKPASEKSKSKKKKKS